MCVLLSVNYTTINLIPFKDHLEQKCESEAGNENGSGASQQGEGRGNTSGMSLGCLLPASARFGGFVVSMHNVDNWEKS